MYKLQAGNYRKIIVTHLTSAGTVNSIPILMHLYGHGNLPLCPQIRWSKTEM